MRAKVTVCLSILIAMSFLVPARGTAITPQQLRAKVRKREKVVIIDIRSKGAYRESHIPGAINIPAPIIPAKKLAPFGRVVVYGDGIRVDITKKAVQDLNSKEGIEAEMLEGGFGAWMALNFPETRKAGVTKEKLKYISYQDLVKAVDANPDIVLVDVRKKADREELQKSAFKRNSRTVQHLGNEPTSLSRKFPDVEKIRLTQDSGFSAKSESIALRRLTGGTGKHYNKLYVLIDNGDGTARRIAHKLKAAGVKRVVILTGGEQSLRTEGKPGVKTIEVRDIDGQSQQ